MAFRKSLAEAAPDLIKEWHPQKNGNITPEKIGYGSTKRIWWICSEGHEWDATPNSRTSPDKIKKRGGKSPGCPYCSGNRVLPQTSLAFKRSDLAKQWHFEKNHPLRPEDVTHKSNKKVYWVCPINEKHVWSASICDRQKHGCPYCSGNLVLSEESLAALHPELVEEWHSKKNGHLKPEQFSPGSGQKVWWECKRNPKHGEWKATINGRARRGDSCPKCHSKISQPQLRIFSELSYIFNDITLEENIEGRLFDIFISSHRIAIEYDGWYTHRNRFEKDKVKVEWATNIGIVVIRCRQEPLEKVSPHDIKIEKDVIQKPEIESILDFIIANAILNPETLERISDYKRERDFVKRDLFLELRAYYPAPVPGTTLTETYPDIASQWHPTKNQGVMPENYSSGSGFVAWWLCEKGHEWLSPIANRSEGKGCPYCAGLYVTEERNLQVINPKLASQWHPQKNVNLTPYQVAPSSSKTVWWLCKKGHEWQAKVTDRARGNGCPFCANQKVISNYNSLAVERPDIAAEWNYEKNAPKKPEEVVAGSAFRVWWKCKQGHEWDMVIRDRTRRKSPCPECQSFGFKYPKLKAQLHPTKNGSFDPNKVKPYSKMKVWWVCQKNPEHVWLTAVQVRTRGSCCPFCRKLSLYTNLSFLANIEIPIH